MASSSNRGGARPNAGRKPSKYNTPICVRITQRAFSALQQLTDHKGEFIDALILEKAAQETAITQA